MPAVLRKDAYKRLDGSLRTRVQRVIRHTEVLGSVGRYEDDTAALIEVAVGLASDEELSTCVDAEDAIEFFLYICH